MFVILPEEMPTRRDDGFISSLHANMALILFFKGHFNIIGVVKNLNFVSCSQCRYKEFVKTTK